MCIRDRGNDAVDRVNEPIFADTGAFVKGALGQVVMAGGGGGEDLDDPIRGAVDVVLGDLGRVADDQNIGLDDGRRLIISFARCRQQDVDRSDQGAAGGAIQG